MHTVVHAPPVVPKPHRFTIQEYLAMGEAGIFGAEDRVELFRGEVIEMSPIGPDHVGAVIMLGDLLQKRAPEGVTVFAQNAVNIGVDSQVQPDVAVMRWTDRVWNDGVTSGDCLLVAEVSLTSLPYDRGRKLELYAEAGIPEYWIVDLRGRCVEIYREPSGKLYRKRTVVGENEYVESAPVAGLRVRVGEVLPPVE